MNLKTPRYRSRAYLQHVASLPCCVCGSSPCQAHHLIHAGSHGMGLRAPDNEALPLCSFCHRALHADGSERRWLAERGIDGPELAGILFQRWRDG